MTLWLYPYCSASILKYVLNNLVNAMNEGMDKANVAKKLLIIKFLIMISSGLVCFCLHFCLCLEFVITLKIFKGHCLIQKKSESSSFPFISLFMDEKTKVQRRKQNAVCHLGSLTPNPTFLFTLFVTKGILWFLCFKNQVLVMQLQYYQKNIIY